MFFKCAWLDVACSNVWGRLQRKWALNKKSPSRCSTASKNQRRDTKPDVFQALMQEYVLHWIEIFTFKANWIAALKMFWLHLLARFYHSALPAIDSIVSSLTRTGLSPLLLQSHSHLNLKAKTRLGPRVLLTLEVPFLSSLPLFHNNNCCCLLLLIIVNC